MRRCSIRVFWAAATVGVVFDSEILAIFMTTSLNFSMARSFLGAGRCWPSPLKVRRLVGLLLGFMEEGF